MDNEIKPPGFGPFIVPGDDKSVESRGEANSADASFAEASFAKAKSKLQAGSPEPAQAGLVIAAEHSKADLQDPEKLEKMVRASVSELIDNAQNVTGPLADSQKASLLEFLSGDPTVRRDIETYLRKVLA